MTENINILERNNSYKRSDKNKFKVTDCEPIELPRINSQNRIAKFKNQDKM